MMAIQIRFNGIPGRTTPVGTQTPEPAVVYRKHVKGEILTGWEKGDELLVDGDVAKNHGGDPRNDGADWAELWVTAQNLIYDPREEMDPRPFTLAEPPKPPTPPKEPDKPASGKDTKP